MTRDLSIAARFSVLRSDDPFASVNRRVETDRRWITAHVGKCTPCVAYEALVGQTQLYNFEHLRPARD